MDQSRSNSTTSATANSESVKKKSKRKLPSPTELVSHYEAQGMDTQEASLKVIEDLQNALFRMMLSSSSASASGRTSKSPPSSDTSRKLDVLNARFLQLDMKLDSKPGYPQTLAIGVASGVLLRGIAYAASQIWNAVLRATSPRTD